MAIVLIDGFDYAPASNMVANGWTANANANGSGRFSGGQDAQITTSLPGKTLPSSYTTLVVGFAWRWTTTSPNATLGVLTLRNVVSNVTVASLTMGNLTNKLSIAGQTGVMQFLSGAWHYIEIKAFVNGASGTIEVRVDGVADIPAATVNMGSTAITQLLIPGQGGTSTTMNYDDMYALDTTGAAPRNDFLADVRVQTIRPTADGAHSDWTPNSGTAHFSRVNETAPDSDTTYVSDSTPGNRDSYVFGDLATSSTVYGLQTKLFARKDDVAVRQIAPVVRQGGVDYDGTTVTLASGYSYFNQIYQQDPTGADWTDTNVNADEFGIKTVA